MSERESRPSSVAKVLVPILVVVAMILVGVAQASLASAPAATQSGGPTGAATGAATGAPTSPPTGAANPAPELIGTWTYVESWYSRSLTFNQDGTFTDTVDMDMTKSPLSAPEFDSSATTGQYEVRSGAVYFTSCTTTYNKYNKSSSEAAADSTPFDSSTARTDDYAVVYGLFTGPNGRKFLQVAQPGESLQDDGSGFYKQ